MNHRQQQVARRHDGQGGDTERAERNLLGQRADQERTEQHAHAEGARKDADEERVCALQGVVVDEGERNTDRSKVRKR